MLWPGRVEPVLGRDCKLGDAGKGSVFLDVRLLRLGKSSMAVCFKWSIFIEEGILAKCFLEVSIGYKPAALDLSIPVGILSEHLGKCLTHKSKYVGEKVEKAD